MIYGGLRSDEPYWNVYIQSWGFFRLLTTVHCSNCQKWRADRLSNIISRGPYFNVNTGGWEGEWEAHFSEHKRGGTRGAMVPRTPGQLDSLVFHNLVTFWGHCDMRLVYILYILCSFISGTRIRNAFDVYNTFHNHMVFVVKEINL